MSIIPIKLEEKKLPCSFLIFKEFNIYTHTHTHIYVYVYMYIYIYIYIYRQRLHLTRKIA